MGLSQSEQKFDDAFSDEETSEYTESPTRQSYRTHAVSSEYFFFYNDLSISNSKIWLTHRMFFYRSQQPRWRFIRRRLPQQQRNTWTRVTLHLQQPRGIHASKPPTTICEKPIRLMDVPKVSIVNSPITSFSNPNQFKI